MLRSLRKSLLEDAYRHSKRASRVNLYEHLARSVRQYGLTSPARTLNVGAGGDIAATICEAGATPISIDIDPAREPDVVGSVEDLSMFDDASFDGVFCMEVLEHVQQPFDAARELARILKPGGVLVGSTPFLLGIHDAPHDYFRYTKYGISLLLKDLVETELTPRNSVFDAAKVLPLRLYAVGTDSEKRKLAWRWPLLRMANWAYAVVGSGITNDDATTGYFFVFKKAEQSTSA